MMGCGCGTRKDIMFNTGGVKTPELVLVAGITVLLIMSWSKKA